MNVTVVICAYTLERWDQLCEAVASCADQTLVPDEVVQLITASGTPDECREQGDQRQNRRQLAPPRMLRHHTPGVLVIHARLPASGPRHVSGVLQISPAGRVIPPGEAGQETAASRPNFDQSSGFGSV